MSVIFTLLQIAGILYFLILLTTLGLIFLVGGPLILLAKLLSPWFTPKARHIRGTTLIDLADPEYNVFLDRNPPAENSSKVTSYSSVPNNSTEEIRMPYKTTEEVFDWPTFHKSREEVTGNYEPSLPFNVNKGRV